MPYAIPSGAILEVTFVGSMYSQTTLSVLHYKYTGAPTLANGDDEIVALGAELNAAGALIPKYKACCSSDWALVHVRYQWVYPIRYRRLFDAAAAGAGTIAIDGAPPNVAAVITKTGIVAARSNIGALHVPGQPSDISANGLVRNTRKPALEALATQVVLTRRTGTMIPLLFNRRQPNDSPPVVSAIVQDTVRVVRRRTVGVGF